MPSLRSLFNRRSVQRLFVGLAAEILVATAIGGCATNPPPQLVPTKPPTADTGKNPYDGPKPILVNPMVPHVLGTDAHSVSPWQNEVAYPDPAKNYLNKWYNLMGRYQVMLTNPTNKKIVDDWMAQFDSLKNKSVEEKATGVEKSVNSYVTYKSDKDLYEVDEYLATPLETIVTKGGDCEDYAILKYYTLRHLGVPAENMFMVFVPSGSENHEILLVNINAPGEEPEYLDLDNTENTLKRGKDIPYKAYYLINETGVWVTPESPWVKDPHKGVASYPQPKSP